jgi:hypothetical protein
MYFLTRRADRFPRVDRMRFDTSIVCLLIEVKQGVE